MLYYGDIQRAEVDHLAPYVTYMMANELTCQDEHIENTYDGVDRVDPSILWVPPEPAWGLSAGGRWPV